jgi:hypothetical protein
VENVTKTWTLTAYIEVELPDEPTIQPEHLIAEAVGKVEELTRSAEGEMGHVETSHKLTDEAPVIDRDTGIEEEPKKRLCLDQRCAQPLGHAHRASCRFSGTVLTLQSGLY